MKKSELKDNHIVENRSGGVYLWCKVKNIYNGNLIHEDSKTLDIVKVYEFETLIWERKEKKTVLELFEGGKEVYFIDNLKCHTSGQIIYGTDGCFNLYINGDNSYASEKDIKYFKDNNILFHDYDDADFYFNVEVELREMEVDFEFGKSNHYIYKNNSGKYYAGWHDEFKYDIKYYVEEIGAWLKANEERYAKYMEMKEGTYAK